MESYEIGSGESNVLFHVESERGVLGAMLRSRDAAMLAFESLKASDFYDPTNREIFDAMQALAATAKPLDLVTLDEELSRRGKLDAVGGSAYLARLIRSVPSVVNARAYIRIVDEKAMMRRLVAA